METTVTVNSVVHTERHGAPLSFSPCLFKHHVHVCKSDTATQTKSIFLCH